MRMIDADALHIDFDKYVEHIRLMKKGRIPKTEIAILLDCKGIINNAPTVDAVPVRHGSGCPKTEQWMRFGYALAVDFLLKRMVLSKYIITARTAVQGWMRKNDYACNC